MELPREVTVNTAVSKIPEKLFRNISSLVFYQLSSSVIFSLDWSSGRPFAPKLRPDAGARSGSVGDPAQATSCR